MLGLIAATEDLILPAGTFGGGAGFVYVFMRGSLNQMKAWKDIVQERNDSNEYLTKENSALHNLLEEHRTLLGSVRAELHMCDANRKIDLIRIKAVEAEIIALKIINGLQAHINESQVVINDTQMHVPTEIQGVIELKDTRETK